MNGSYYKNPDFIPYSSYEPPKEEDNELPMERYAYKRIQHQ